MIIIVAIIIISSISISSSSSSSSSCIIIVIVIKAIQAFREQRPELERRHLQQADLELAISVQDEDFVAKVSEQGAQLEQLRRQNAAVESQMSEQAAQLEQLRRHNAALESQVRSPGALPLPAPAGAQPPPAAASASAGSGSGSAPAAGAERAFGSVRSLHEKSRAAPAEARLHTIAGSFCEVTLRQAGSAERAVEWILMQTVHMHQMFCRPCAEGLRRCARLQTTSGGVSLKMLRECRLEVLRQALSTLGVNRMLNMYIYIYIYIYMYTYIYI